MSSPNRKSDLPVKVAVLESELTTVKENIEKILTNHLPHLQKEVEAVNEKVSNINLKLALWSGVILAGMWFIEHMLKK